MISRRGFLAASSAGAAQGQDQKSNMFGDAQAYERFMGRWSRLVAGPLVDFTNVPDSGRALDVGSGSGALAFAIARMKPRVHVLGIDPSKEYVDYSNTKNEFGNRASFEVGDAQELGYPDDSFDASLSLLVFNFIPNPQKALLEVRRVTRPGGPVSAAIWDYGAGMQMLRIFWDAAAAVDPQAEKKDEKHMRLCRSGELTALWKQGGLTGVEEHPLDIQMRFTSFADYWDPFLLRQGPAGAYIATLDSRQVAALRAEVTRRLRVSSETEPLVLPGRVWAVRGMVAKRA